MSISKQQGGDFLAKMKEKAASKPAAPLTVVASQAAPTPAPAPASSPPKAAKPTFAERTMSFKLAEVDYDAVDEVILKRKRAGERGMNNKEAGREMVALWLEKHGVKPFDYKS